MDPLFPVWSIVIASAALGVLVGVLYERTRGSAAKRAAKFEADLVQARSELMRYQEQTKRHFGKSAELLGRMATDYREFLHHFVSGAEELCGPHLKELDASGLERPLLDGAPAATPTEPAFVATAPAEPAFVAAAPAIAAGVSTRGAGDVPRSASETSVAAGTIPRTAGTISRAAGAMPLATAVLDSEPLAEDAPK